MAWVVFAFIAGVLVWVAIAFNRLVRLRNQVRTAWADIDVQLHRRHDLVPNLVAAVRAYAGHEQATLESVAQARSRAMSATTPTPQGRAETELEAGIGRLLALRESYPELKASGNFAQLQRDLVAVEDQLQYARRFYNGAVRDYNDAIQRVPDVLIARVFSFLPGEFFQAEAPTRTAPEVQL
ncbi:MAG: LemA family protein [Chiayiivirga sp.]|jgi:LemA protein|uniref:LemA family protein n=1 Tax=Denitratimonas tolerans TaxID=1338420 RepID=A0AAW9R2L9_9GAMM|nr:LemA family protein [Chiayiivirga sp.]